MTKICFIGSHGLSKSTGANLLSSLIKSNYRNKNVGVLGENVREVNRICGEMNTENFVRLAFATQLYKETYYGFMYDTLIIDRSILDPFVYHSYYDTKKKTYSDIDCYKDFMYEYAETYDRIYFVRPSNEPLQGDGFRMTDEKERNEIDKLFSAYLKEMYYPVVEIPSNEILTFDYLKDLKDILKE